VRTACFNDHPGYRYNDPSAFVHSDEGFGRPDTKIKLACKGCWPKRIAQEETDDTNKMVAGTLTEVRNIEKIEADCKYFLNLMLQDELLGCKYGLQNKRTPRRPGLNREPIHYCAML
jgi:hypothetical protein